MKKENTKKKERKYKNGCSLKSGAAIFNLIQNIRGLT